MDGWMDGWMDRWIDGCISYREAWLLLAPVQWAAVVAVAVAVAVAVYRLGKPHIFIDSWSVATIQALDSVAKVCHFVPGCTDEPPPCRRMIIPRGYRSLCPRSNPGLLSLITMHYLIWKCCRHTLPAFAYSGHCGMIESLKSGAHHVSRDYS
jgi:hypothetical protein